MSWAKKRIEAYRHGVQSTWLERLLLDAAYPVNLLLSTLGGLAMLYGLWVHDWTAIVIGVVLSIVGYITAWSAK